MRRLVYALALGSLTISSAALANPLAIAEPLQAFGADVNATSEPAPTTLPALQKPGLESAPDSLVIEGLTIEGSRGDGLNAAALIYRAFSTLGLNPAVHCQIQPAAEGQKAGLFRSTIALRFQEQLSHQQQQDVRQMLASLAQRDPAMALVP